MKDFPTKAELRPGIGLCDQCGLPKWPQQDIGYGMMLCADCLSPNALVCPIARTCKSTLKKYCQHLQPHSRTTECQQKFCSLDISQLKDKRCQPANNSLTIVDDERPLEKK